MGDYIALGLIVVILAAAITYIIRSKKNGVKCIGCPSGCKACSGAKNKTSCCCGCNTQQEEK
ncbi:MAG: FeoB-associated Cys-rich membrane protein [Clostridia bacterium]|nr:FeoB-associated Cys-rich membrane protein [Clostridia bacterium]